jgi:hypothetical protein
MFVSGSRIIRLDAALLILLSSCGWPLDAELTFCHRIYLFVNLSLKTKKKLYCRELNSQAEQADSLIDSIIQVLDIQYTWILLIKSNI